MDENTQRLINEINENRKEFLKKLESAPPKNERENDFISKGKQIINAVDDLMHHSAKKLTHEELVRLNHTLQLSMKTVDNVRSGTDIKPACKELIQLSQKLPGTNKKWLNLASGILFFVAAAAAVASLVLAVPTAGASLIGLLPALSAVLAGKHILREKEIAGEDSKLFRSVKNFVYATEPKDYKEIVKSAKEELRSHKDEAKNNATSEDTDRKFSPGA